MVNGGQYWYYEYYNSVTHRITTSACHHGWENRGTTLRGPGRKGEERGKEVPVKNEDGPEERGPDKTSVDHVDACTNS